MLAAGRRLRYGSSIGGNWRSRVDPSRSDGAVIADRVGDTGCTFLAGLYKAEQAIANLICIANGNPP